MHSRIDSSIHKSDTENTCQEPENIRSARVLTCQVNPKNPLVFVKIGALADLNTAFQQKMGA
jgi:hypothetical protein